MKIKDKFAALLRRWAYALHPETPATLPPGYQVAKIVRSDAYAPTDGTMPPPGVVSLIRGQLIAEVAEQVIKGDYIRTRADIAPVPGGLIEYEASLYVGFIPKKTK
ncbi:hypothetical protein E4T81_01785 [Barnesiella sp. WM24]|uniref:hypothetical protein n=1 Tax=Barnesiella sp. WM24 TaxID=2558278 RepID=UPI0010725C69|nr:hypothetical protein [Barnesiella sp. WM24]TFU95285.1 hypothetical protein E4T81_01785 [Barnesiella sp. WM24]